MSETRATGIFQSLQEDDPCVVAGYRLSARLGAGGMGKVYLSYTPGGRPIAIKVIRPELAEDSEFRRRFAREVHAAQRVQGLFTAPVIDCDADAPQPWLATAYVPGPTLATAVAQYGPLPVSTVLFLIAGIAEGLSVIHGASIIHRDLKPSNVILASDGPRIIDFGIARAADVTALTGSGVTVGTPAFMAPEQAAGQAVGPTTDVFALGQVAAFAAIGMPAYGDGPSHGVLYRIVHEDPDLSALPVELLTAVTRCLAKDPSQRASPSEIISLCRAASHQTQLRRPEDWLPSTIAADITQRLAAPAPKLAHATLPPTAPLTQPDGSHRPSLPAGQYVMAPPAYAYQPTPPLAGPPLPRPYGPPPKRNRGAIIAAAILGSLVLTMGGCAVLVASLNDETTGSQRLDSGNIKHDDSKQHNKLLETPQPTRARIRFGPGIVTIKVPDEWHVDLDSNPPLVADTNGEDIFLTASSLGTEDDRFVLAPLPSVGPEPGEAECTTQIEKNGTYTGDLTRGARFCLQTVGGRTAYIRVVTAGEGTVRLRVTVWELPE